VVVVQAAASIVQTFSDETGTERFNHLVVGKNTGLVLIGAVNRLYQLSPDLALVMSEVTGPRDDSPECLARECPPTVLKKLTDNVNKALVIDYTTTRLISCESIFQGSCSVKNLHNISDVAQVVRESVVRSSSTASTVAFIAPGPPKPPVTQVMYVGVTYTGNYPYRSWVPAVSSRNLDRDKMFNIAEKAVTKGTRMFVNSLAREDYLINYVHGFSSEGFSYFLTTQKRDLPPSPFISKLVFVCHDDESYYSYTEIPIDCISEGAKRYNLVQAAYVGKPGSDLAADLGITAQDDVLFAVFSKSDQSEGEVFSKPSSNSAL
jgi:plexin A